jgi:hypothetical protein
VKKVERGLVMNRTNFWSGRRDLNPRLRPWQGRTLPLSYSRSNTASLKGSSVIINNVKIRSNGRRMLLESIDVFVQEAWRKIVVAFLVPAGSAFAQDGTAAMKLKAAACGPPAEEFKVKIVASPPTEQAESDKALIYVIEDQRYKAVRKSQLLVAEAAFSDSHPKK